MATRVPSSVPGHRAAEKSPQNPMARASAASSCMVFFMFLLGWGLVCAVVSCGTLKKYSASELLSKSIYLYSKSLESFAIAPIRAFFIAGHPVPIGVQRYRSLRAVLEQEWRCGHSAGRIGVRLFAGVTFEHEAFGTLGDKQGRPVEGDECVSGDRDVPVATFTGSVFVEVG